MYVALSFVALALGALLAAPLLRRPALFAATDAFVLVALAGLIVFHVLPQSVHETGALSALLLGLGALAPYVIERLRTAAPQAQPGWGAFSVALVGVAAHAVLDGLAFVDDLGDHGHAHEGSVPALGLAVLLHRVPVGLSLVWVVLPRAGRARTALMAAVLIAFTIVGYVGGDAIAHAGAAAPLALVQVFVAGSVLHVLFAHRAPVADDAPARVGSVVGAGVAVAVLVALSLTHPAEQHFVDELAFGPALLMLLRESALPLLVSFVGVGLMHAVLAEPVRLSTQPRSPFVGALLGTAAGLPMPLCSCSVVPLYTGLVRRGVSGPAAIAFLVAAPELGVPALLLSFTLLGAGPTLLRAVGAALLAIVVGVVVGAKINRARSASTSTSTSSTSSMSATAAPPATRPPLTARVTEGLRYGFVEAVDHTAPWLMFGLLSGALIEPLVSPQAFAALPAGVDVVALALLGVPLYVCASGSTPLAAVLLHKGVSVGAVTALLLTGPATNLSTLGLMSRLHGKKIALAFAATVAGGAIAVGLVGNALGAVVDVDVGAFHAAAPADHGHARVVEELAALVLGLVVLASLLRQGVRRFVGQITESHDHDADGNCVHGADHVHGPHCNHNHGAALAPPVVEIAPEHLRFGPSTSTAPKKPSLLR